MGCAHEGCLCQVEGAGAFCGAHCAEHAPQSVHDEHACECGHPACQQMGD